MINELEGEQPDELRLEDAVHGSGGHRPHDDVIGLELGNELGQNLVLLLLGRREHDLEMKPDFVRMAQLAERLYPLPGVCSSNPTKHMNIFLQLLLEKGRYWPKLANFET